MVTAKTIKLRVSPIESPDGDLVPARGFYQMEEEELYVQIGRFKTGERFFSSLESEHVRFECDKRGRLIFIELSIPRRRWREENNFAPPEPSERADIRFLDFRTTINEPEIYCDKAKCSVRFQFSDMKSRSIRMGEHLVFDVGSDNTLASIWISGIVDDMAGREIATFRRTISKSKA